MKDALSDRALGALPSVAVVISSHGNEAGLLFDGDQNVTFTAEVVLGAMAANDSLIGKPKIIIVDACRGGKAQPSKEEGFHVSIKMKPSHPHPSVLIGELDKPS